MTRLQQSCAIPLLASVAVLTGCSSIESHHPVTTSTTAEPELKGAGGREAMASFGLEMPTNVQHEQLAQPHDDSLRFQGVVTFVAPRQQVIEQTCKNLQHKSFDEPPILQGIDYTLYRSYVFPPIDFDNYGSCYQFTSGRKINVLVPRINGDPTHVILYDMRFR